MATHLSEFLDLEARASDDAARLALVDQHADLTLEVVALHVLELLVLKQTHVCTEHFCVYNTGKTEVLLS